MDLDAKILNDADDAKEGPSSGLRFTAIDTGLAGRDRRRHPCEF